MTDRYTEAWERIIKDSKKPSLEEFKNWRDLSDLQIIETGKPNLDQILLILDSIQNCYDPQTAIILPERILYTISQRDVEKNVRPITLERIRTKKEAIERLITPEVLIREAFAKLRGKYLENPETLMMDYAFINYVGITDRKIKNYLVSDAIKGYLHAKNSGPLIIIRRYDTLENFIETKDFRSFDIHNKRVVFDLSRAVKRKEIEKIRRRKMLTDLPKKVREIILTKQSERVVLRIPSIEHFGEYQSSIKFRKLPQQFPDDKFPELNRQFHAVWTDFYTEPSCNCEDKTWFINYIAPNQIWFCVHEIAAYRKMVASDWQNGQPTTFPNPFIAASPFFKPKDEAIRNYYVLKNQVFVKNNDGQYYHLPEVYVSIWLEKQARRGKIDLL